MKKGQPKSVTIKLDDLPAICLNFTGVYEQGTSPAMLVTIDGFSDEVRTPLTKDELTEAKRALDYAREALRSASVARGESHVMIS